LQKERDLKSLEIQLKNIFAQYHAPKERYRHVAFSSKDESELNELATTLPNVLPNYTVWDGNQPTENAPPAECSRFDFIQQTFNSDLTGLIILHPDYWTRYWSHLDKQAFWAALSTRHGGHNVVVVLADNHEFHAQNNHYLVPHELPNAAMTLWVSTKIPLTR
jgi:hypothetical protein